MIHVGTNITSNLLREDADYLRSLSKNSQFRNFVMCCGFEASEELIKAYPKIDFINVSQDLIKTRANNGWPVNRKGFLTLQSGEFINFLTNVDDNDIIIYTDYDITIQRSLNEKDLAFLESLDDDTLAMQYDCFPQMDLHDYCTVALKPKCGMENLQNYFENTLKGMIAYNSGVMVARAKFYKKLWTKFEDKFKFVPELFIWHAAVQFVINYASQSEGMKVKLLPKDFHDGHWLSGTKTKTVDSKLKIDDEAVLFAHHKFQRKFSY